MVEYLTLTLIRASRLFIALTWDAFSTNVKCVLEHLRVPSYRILRSLGALARSCSCSTSPYPQTSGSGSLVLPWLMVQPLKCVARLLFAHLSRVFSQLNTSCSLSPQIPHYPHPTFLGVPDCMLLHCALVTLGSLPNPGLCLARLLCLPFGSQ